MTSSTVGRNLKRVGHRSRPPCLRTARRFLSFVPLAQKKLRQVIQHQPVFTPECFHCGGRHRGPGTSASFDPPMRAEMAARSAMSSERPAPGGPGLGVGNGNVAAAAAPTADTAYPKVARGATFQPCC